MEAHCDGRAAHHLGYETETRIGALLEEVGGEVEPRLRADRPCGLERCQRPLMIVPAGMDLWGFTPDVRYVRDVTLLFDFEQLGELLEERLDQVLATTPNLRFADDALWTLMKLLADAVEDDDVSSQLYGDGLTSAIVARLLARKPASERPRASGLAPWQLRRVLDYIDAHLTQRIELARLAQLTGLSQSRFSHAFKTSVGVAPYRYQTTARIRRAQTLLRETAMSLDEISVATGYADGVHFGRMFRRIVGSSPVAWRRIVKS
ncbi:MAG: AraC family transcriptional regulator [Polyangiales bacterium]